MILDDYRRLYIDDTEKYTDVILTDYQLKVLLKLSVTEFLSVPEIVELMLPYVINNHAMNDALSRISKKGYLERNEIKLNNRVGYEYRRLV